eukprot:6660445-Heterocapsa_arctica.AAC.1
MDSGMNTMRSRKFNNVDLCNVSDMCVWGVTVDLTAGQLLGSEPQHRVWVRTNQCARTSKR